MEISGLAGTTSGRGDSAGGRCRSTAGDGGDVGAVEAKRKASFLGGGKAEDD